MFSRKALLILIALALVLVALVGALALTRPAASPPIERFTTQREEMVADQIHARGVNDAQVLDAAMSVPRHEFVLPETIDEAYEDHPLPIGYGQTISQPYIVAVMTELAQIKRGDRVLEIGTGSGYQAAMLARLTDEVYSVEIIPELAARAEMTLKRLGYNVVVKNDDGYNGWQEHAPYDAILVTCAPDHVPPPLIAQLKEGGRLIIPVGPTGGYQTLWRIIKRGDKVISENIMGVLFVPLTRGK